MPVLQTLGTIAGYSVTVNRRASSAGDNVFGRTAIAVTLTKGASITEAAILEDTGNAASDACLIGLSILKAFAGIGATTTLTDGGQMPVSASSTGGTSPYVRAVPLVPGTPLPAGRGAFVKSAGGGTVLLKLSGGGAMPVSDPTGGAGFPFNNLAVVDADISGAPGASVSILY